MSKEDDKVCRMNTTMGTLKKNRVLVTITPYSEQEKRVVNPAPVTSCPIPPAPPAPPAPPPLPLFAKPKTNEDAVEMQSIESFKLKESPNPVIPKPPPNYFPLSNSTATPSTNGSPRHVAGNKAQINGKDNSSSPVLDSKTSPSSGVPTLKPVAGKVAIRIGAYEGEAKQPSKLEFLSQQPRVDKNGSDELANGPVVSRLQNELVATLQRSNLRRKTEGDSQPSIKPIPENAMGCVNETTNSESSKLSQSNVEKLALALNNKVTIKVNPENNNNR